MGIDKIAYYGGGTSVSLVRRAHSEEWATFSPEGGGSDPNTFLVPVSVRDTYIKYRKLDCDFLVLDEKSLRRLHPRIRTYLPMIGFQILRTIPSSSDSTQVRIWIYQLRKSREPSESESGT